MSPVVALFVVLVGLALVVYLYLFQTSSPPDANDGGANATSDDAGLHGDASGTLGSGTDGDNATDPAETAEGDDTSDPLQSNAVSADGDDDSTLAPEDDSADSALSMHLYF